MRLRGCLLVLVGLVVLGLPAGATAEEGCPNEAVRVAESTAHPEGFASGLPDCRAYEQVTPVGKDGTNPTGGKNTVQASFAGDRIVFPVVANMPGANSGPLPSFFMAGRGGEGWSDRGVDPPQGPRARSEVLGWGEDLADAVVFSHEIGMEAMYLRDSATGAFQLGFSRPTFNGMWVAGFSADDSRMFFETPSQLLPSAAAGKHNLYELHGGALSLVGVLPDESTPAGGSYPGPAGGVEDEFYLQSAISRDGSRVFFTAGGTEQLYVREGGARTVAVGTGVFMAATPDGSQVVYLAGGDLSEFDVESEQTMDLAPGKSVEGLLGVSEDGSYVYFAANGGEIYVWHDGVVGFVATSSNPNNWAHSDEEHDSPTPKVSRVSADGRFLLFTGSNGQLYRYDAAHDAAQGRLACVSCAPSGVPPVAPATLSSIQAYVANGSRHAILLRNFSRDGSRVFFETVAALLPRDTNGLQDVYEWEQQGVGSCQAASETFSAASGGCLYLISSGTSSEASYFADASASGDDVFFFTDQPLVGQDQDGNVDIYDARVGGGFAAQNPPPAPAACEGEGCRPAAGVPVFGVPASAAFAGVGNQTPPPPVVAAPKPRPKAKHKAAKPKRKRKRRRRARKAGRSAQVVRRAGMTTEGGK